MRWRILNLCLRNPSLNFPGLTTWLTDKLIISCNFCRSCFLNLSKFSSRMSLGHQNITFNYNGCIQNDVLCCTILTCWRSSSSKSSSSSYGRTPMVSLVHLLWLLFFFICINTAIMHFEPSSSRLRYLTFGVRTKPISPVRPFTHPIYSPLFPI